MTQKKSGHNKNTNRIPGWDVKESAIKDNNAPRSRVSLRIADFDNLMKQKSVRLKVYRTTYCPNVKSVDSAEHDIDCEVCNGSGWLDVKPICTEGYIQNQALEKQPHIEGLVDGNNVAITFPIGIELQYFTLVELMDFTDIFMQRVLRKEGSDVDILKYRACRVNVLVDRDGNDYLQDQDFKINVNGDIEWTGTRRPGDNVPYSIHYEAAVQFRAVQALHVNRFTQIETPEGIEHVKLYEQWICAKEFLVRRKDTNGTELKQGPYDVHTIIED